MPLLTPAQLAEQTFQLAYHIPGLTYSDIASWDFKRRQSWVKLLIKQKREEEEALKKLPKIGK